MKEINSENKNKDLINNSISNSNKAKKQKKKVIIINKPKLEQLLMKKESDKFKKEKEKANNNNSSGGGFFGTFKYMLGLSKKKDVNFEEQAIIEKQKKEIYQKLSDNLSKVFLFYSTDFTNESLINILNALLQSSIDIMEQNKDNQVALLNFNLIKLFELLIVNLNRFNLMVVKDIIGVVLLHQLY